MFLSSLFGTCTSQMGYNPLASHGFSCGADVRGARTAELSNGRRVKRETGERHAISAQSLCCPRNGKEARVHSNATGSI